MKIPIGFVFNHAFFLGGGEHSLFLLIESLQGSEFEPVGIVPETGEISARLEERGIVSTVCPFHPLRPDTLAASGADVRTLTAAVGRYGLRILHANGSRACLYSGIAGRSRHVPVIWHVRESIRDHIFYDGLLGLLSNRIVCVSHAAARKRFHRFGGLLAGKISVVHNGADPSRFNGNPLRRRRMRDALRIGTGETLLSLVGNYVPLKGHPHLLRAFAEARKWQGLNMKLLCAGRVLDADYHRSLLTLLGELGIEADVTLLDYTPDIAGLLCATDIFVLPSQREGFSRSLLEAMAMGLPVIASRIGEIAEAVEDQRGGILAGYGNVAELSQAIRRLSQDPVLRQRMGDENRKRFLRHFTQARHTGAFRELYRSLLTHGPTP